MKSYCVLLFCTLFPLYSLGAVWKVTASWSPAQEEAFSQYVEHHFHFDIFSNTESPFYGIETDCADSVYAARIIFAARVGLPVLFSDPTSRRHNISQNMSRWDHLPEEDRLRKFIDYVGDLTSTQTLEWDTYHVEISKAWFRPGIIFLSPHLSLQEQQQTGFRGGHAEYVKSLSENGFIEVISSTSPRLVRPLSLGKNPYMAPLVHRGGYRKWRQPEDINKSFSQLPGFGLSQFSLADWAPLRLTSRKQIFQWHEAIRLKLRERPPTFEERVKVVTDNICDLLKVRARLIYQGWSLVSGKGHQCLQGDLQDEYSTNSRDRRIRDAYMQVWDLYDWKKRSGDLTIRGDLSDAQEVLSECRFEHWPGRSISAWELKDRVLQNRLESSANYAPAVRWGERPSTSKDCR